MIWRWKKEIPSISHFWAADEKWLGGFYSGSDLNSNARQFLNSAQGSESNGCPALADVLQTSNIDSLQKP